MFSSQKLNLMKVFWKRNTKEIKIFVKKIAKNETIISISMEEQNKEFIQEIISQINQVLS